MYESYFNFSSKPFDLLPNPDFLYLSKTHRKALSYLKYGIQERSGFILLTGEVGSGKTTIIRDLVKKQLQNVVLAKVFNTRVDSHQLITMINDDFGLETGGKEKVTLLKELNDFLIRQFASGQRCVLIIDEAQNLSSELLEEIRMLSNLETDSGKLLQIILVGQPELRETLNSPQLIQLRQRIQIYCHLHPLSSEELGEYIRWRMEKAGNRDAIVLPADAVDLIHTYTHGIPRLINILCDYILLDAFVNERKQVLASDVEEISTDLKFEEQFWVESEKVEEPELKSKTSEKSKAKPKNIGAAASKAASMIQEFGKRLDSLEKEAFKTNYSAIADMRDRLEELEKKVNLQKQQSEMASNYVREIMATLEKQKAEQLEEKLQPVREPGRRGWFMEFLFGNE